jgi:hypothetical protein
VSQADESDNGRTLTIAAGASVQVVLHSTYWHFARPTPDGVLRASAPAAHAATSGPAYPGSGAGTVRETFTGVRAGTATVIATRTSCGEALRCTTGAGRFDLVVIVR